LREEAARLPKINWVGWTYSEAQGGKKERVEGLGEVISIIGYTVRIKEDGA
jgi:hypothetical protein